MSIIIATYDSNEISYYQIEKSNQLKVLLNLIQIFVVPDVDDPFCAVQKEFLKLNIDEDYIKIERIFEFIELSISNVKEGINKFGTSTGAAIYSGYQCISDGKPGRLIIFSCNENLQGYASSSILENKSWFLTDNEMKLYNPQVI